MKKQLSYIAGSLAALLLFAGCADEEKVAPTANRAGLSSLAAYFTAGPNVDKLAVNWQIDNSSDITDYVIPIPYYYPEESDNTTEEYLKSMKIVATLENNCKLEPGLGVLDLTKKNEFTYTDPYGQQKSITISGQMTRSDKCQIKAFALQPGDFTGVIDEAAKTIYLATGQDLTDLTADITLSPHATISPDPAQPLNYNTPVEFTVTADNGTDKATYTVIKQVPQKIKSGYRAGSETKLFENDMTTLGVTNPAATHPTLACIGGSVILNLGDGSVPQYFRKATGTLMGTINLGSAKATGAITSDCAGNMLICDFAQSGQTLHIWKTNSVTTAPELFLSYPNNLGVDIGARLHVQGDLNGNAIITATPYNCQNAIRWIVTNGQAGPAENILFSGVNAWGGQDGVSKVVACSTNTADGCLFDYYDSGNCPLYYAKDWKNATQLLSGNSSGAGWGYNTGAADIREFNGARYLSVFEMGYWPSWGLPGHIYLYDATAPATLSGTIDTSSSLKYTYTMGDLYGSVGAAADGRFGDVLITPSEDGYILYIFYASNTHLSFGGLQVDCIDK